MLPQEYLTHCCEGQTLLMVSHDRAFLNAVCQETVEVKDKQLRYGSGAAASQLASWHLRCAAVEHVLVSSQHSKVGAWCGAALAHTHRMCVLSCTCVDNFV